MSSLFIDSLDLTNAPGAYAIEITPPIIIEGQVIGYLGYIFKGEWGPVNAVTEPAGSADFLSTYFPPGSPHTSSGYYGLMRRKRIPLRPARIALNAVKAVTTAAAGAGTYTATVKYEGVLGNSVTVAWKAATDGDAAKRNVEVTLSHAVTGTTKEVYRNVALAAGGSVDVAASILLGAFTFSAGATALPAAGTTVSLGATTAGTDGDPLTSAQYRAALDLLAVRTDIFVVTTDDPGAGIRNAVNDELVLHANTYRNRVTVFQTANVSETWANVKSYVDTHAPTIRGDRVIPVGAWVQTLDDAGVAQTTPFATYVASALVNLEPQQSHAWWDDRGTEFYTTVAGLVAPFSTGDDTVQGEAVDKGILLPMRLGNGRFAALHDRTASMTSGKKFMVTRRLKDFFARSIVAAIVSYVNGPNIRGKHLEIKALVDAFMKGQRDRTEPRVVSFSTAIDTVNTPASIALGQFKLALDATTPAVMEKIGLLLNAGETVTVRETT